MSKLRSAAVAALALIASAPAAAATQIVTNGILTGATGVVVNGVTYSVAFGDSTCAAAFDGCDSNSDFIFSTNAQVLAAGQALLNQVFLDTAAGNFDSNQALTSGCGFNTLYLCFVAIPYAVGGENFVAGGPQNWGGVSANADVAFDGSTPSTSINYSIMLNLSSQPRTTFAKFCLQGATCTIAQPQAVPAAVPEPATWAMMLLGFGGIGSAIRRRRRASAHKASPA